MKQSRVSAKGRDIKTTHLFLRVLLVLAGVLILSACRSYYGGPRSGKDEVAVVEFVNGENILSIYIDGRLVGNFDSWQIKLAPGEHNIAFLHGSFWDGGLEHKYNIGGVVLVAQAGRVYQLRFSRTEKPRRDLVEAGSSYQLQPGQTENRMWVWVTEKKTGTVVAGRKP